MLMRKFRVQNYEKIDDWIPYQDKILKILKEVFVDK